MVASFVPRERRRRRALPSARKPHADLEQQLESCRRELAEARTHLAEAVERETATSEVLQASSPARQASCRRYSTQYWKTRRAFARHKFGTLFRFDGEAFHFAARIGSHLNLQKSKSGADHFYRCREHGRSCDADRTGLPHPRRSWPKLFLGRRHSSGATRSALVCADGQRRNVDRRYRHLPRRRSGHSPINRSSWSRTSPPRPSSPSRTRGCSTELREASCNSRPRPSEVLKGIIRVRPASWKPVFQAMLENAVRICEARFRQLVSSIARRLRVVALHNAPPAYAGIIATGKLCIVGRTASSARSALADSKQVVHIADLTTNRPTSNATRVASPPSRSRAFGRSLLGADA